MAKTALRITMLPVLDERRNHASSRLCQLSSIGPLLSDDVYSKKCNTICWFMFPCLEGFIASIAESLTYSRGLLAARGIQQRSFLYDNGSCIAMHAKGLFSNFAFCIIRSRAWCLGEWRI